ncbi:MAG: ATP-dependent DNA ligase, partial [Candidatus Levybacteria bacterium]|nr:ATP-dependent DNA ligase [Candidatus Levybacteria bacterium]
MAEKNVAKAIASAFGVNPEEVTRQFNSLGDMGLAASQFAKKSKDGNISVLEVHKTLTEIANTKGEGTVEKRQKLLADLLSKMDLISAKHLVRIPLGNTRLGIGDPTVLDALATAKLGDKTKRKLLEGAYNKTSDLGLIAKTLWEKGLTGVEKLDVRVGSPIRSELCERLPSAQKVIEKMGAVDSQPKMDGIRIQVHKDKDKIRMFSRNLEEMTHMFPELIEASKKQIKAETAILDTEALAYNPDSEEFLPFQETTKRRRKHGIEEMAKTLPLKAFVFDILYKDGKSLIDEPLRKRMEILSKTIIEDGVLIRTKNQIVKDPKTLNLLKSLVTK